MAPERPDDNPTPEAGDEPRGEVWRIGHDRVVIPSTPEQGAAYGGDNASADVPDDRPARHTRGRRATDPQGIEPSQPLERPS